MCVAYTVRLHSVDGCRYCITSGVNIFRDGLSSIRRGLSSIQLPLSRDLDATAASAPFFSTALMYLHLIYVTSLVILCNTNPFFIILPKNQSRQFHLQDFHLRKALQNLH